MTVLPILIAPHPILRKKAEPVVVIDDTIRRLLQDMEDTMYAEDGIGLAAPQVGVSKQILVMNIPSNLGVDSETIEGIESISNLFFMINPEIICKSEETSTCQEGCLSVPKQFAEITRPAEITVRYMNEVGEIMVHEFKNLQATCVQHEMDHLNGRLFVDYLSNIKRDMLIRKAQKVAQRL